MRVVTELKFPVRVQRFTKIGIAVCAATALFCASASATLTSIGAFSGNITETWESFPNYSEGGFHTLPSSTSIMGGNATISNPYMMIYEPGYEPGIATFNLGSSGLAQVSDGRKGMGLNNIGQTVTISFANAISDFGAYWGAATDVSLPLSDPTTIFLITFGDGSSTSFTYSRSGPKDGLLQWHGWHSDVGITSISYTGDYVVVDGLQANMVVPEPSTYVAGLLLVISFGVHGVRRLRRSAS